MNLSLFILRMPAKRKVAPLQINIEPKRILIILKEKNKKIPTRQVWPGSFEGQPVRNRPYIRGLRGGFFRIAVYF